MQVFIVTRGDRELALRFDQFPAEMRSSLRERIEEIVEELEGGSEAAAPVKTGRLRGEIRSQVYEGPDRVAGYVSVRAAGDANNEYAKAATLEYGTNKARRLSERRGAFGQLLGRSRRRIIASMTKVVHIGAFRYLRGPFEADEAAIMAELEEARDEAIAASSS